jgi:hypothetical protein
MTSTQNPERLETLNHSTDISSVMLIKFVSKYLFDSHKFLLPFLVIVIFSNADLHSQALTNLDVFYSLTDSLVDKINLEIPENQKKISVILNLGDRYSLFANTIEDRFSRDEREIIKQSNDNEKIPNVNIVMEGAGVEYGEMFRSGFFGTHYIQRYSTIFGNYLHTFSDQGIQKFEITSIDTIKVEEISSLENPAYPFTQASIPPEPFISGLAEPIIAIGTAAIVVVLFFTIRSE